MPATTPTPDLATALNEATQFASGMQRALKTLGQAGEVTLGPTPRDAVYAEDRLVLYRFRPQVERAGRGTQLVICYQPVTRPWMIDLQEDRR